MVVSAIFDHAARVHSYELLADIGELEQREAKPRAALE
jgi:hypothetical protein